MVGAKIIGLMKRSARSARLLQAAIAIATPSLICGYAYARPIVLTGVTIQNTSPVLDFYITWETTDQFGIPLVMYADEGTTYDNDPTLEQLSYGPDNGMHTLAFSDGAGYFWSSFTDPNIGYEFFMGVPADDGDGVTFGPGDGNHSEWL
jgi:hypothetical protein